MTTQNEVLFQRAQQHIPAGVNSPVRAFRAVGGCPLFFERGAGETLACGTGAAAAVAVGRRWGQLAQEVVVSLPGGELVVNWPSPGAPLWQTGATTAVYEGTIEI